ncbi:hypothetical protein SAMD00023353_2601030 [Rosellinia necatrix]|uniref:Uncharacterized protein n=1 Tax=Rosellinia necatrix TaxID=77044 RepID=A0A1W2TH45_ROSNE|nr:hypothetical protein SAMD00023353_2601030 [Rosellinia necatrix]
MDGVHIARSLGSSPAKGKAGNLKKAAGRGASKKARKNGGIVKKSGRPKGRGRNKTYEDPRAQAAYDRQKALRDLYLEVASAIKPVLEDLADTNVKKLVEHPTAYKEVPEYHTVQRELDERLAEAIRTADREFNTRAAIATREYQLNTAVTEKKFHEGYDHAAQEFYDASLKRTILLAELQQERVGVDLPDTTYNFVEQPDEVIAEQATWVLFRNGVKVPYPYLLEENRKAAVTKVQTTKGKPPTKRKAEDQPDGQPDSKKSAGTSGSTKQDNGDETSTPQPRHIKGLLSAETEPDGEPGSNAASPSPSPESDPKTDISCGRRDLPDLPNGASEPDKWGVRTVMRRGPRANNRLILPPLTFDDDDIGFRDSTNDSSKRATRGTRGRFLDSPNSRNLHIDRTIVTYDCLDYEDNALDPKLVQRHTLHPKYGLFLPESRNESEPPKDPVSGSNPIAVITPNGATLHASRSVRGYNMDATLREDAKKDRLSLLLTEWCEQTGIEADEITTEEIRERKRRRCVAALPPAVSEETGENLEEAGTDTGDAGVDEAIAKENTSRLLNAASYLEQDRPNHPTSSQRLSRPYDAVRDVFTNAEPTPPPPMPPMEIDTFGLSFLADVSEHVSLQREAHYDPPLDHRLEPPVEYRPDYQLEHHPHMQYEYRHEYMPDHRPSHHLEHRLDQPELSLMGDSMIDPRLLGHPNPAPPPSAFLQTALNPPPTLAHIAPAPSQGIEPPVQASVGRIPFTSQGSGKASPVLPPLRPSRREKGMDPTHPPSLIQQAPDFGPPLGMIQSNSGSFFPPAPSRPYHQGYTLLEQNPVMGMPFSMSGGGMASQPSPHMGLSHRHSYQPPSPTMSSHGQIVTMPLHMPHGSSVSPPGSSMGLRSPTGPPGSRHRASISSGSNGPGNGKYRKIAAAPIPHNRPWPANGGAELRLAHYDHKEAIKDYRANEPPPRTGPTTIRGWNVNNVSKGRKGLKKEDSEEKDSPSMTTFINKWNPSEKTIG